MNRKLKLPGMLHHMPKLALLLAAMLFYARPAQAIIPPSITGTYNVFSIENCPTACTIQNGGTLSISGVTANSTFSGSITIMPGGQLIIQNGGTVKMAANTKIIAMGNTATISGGFIFTNKGHITSTGVNVFWSGIETPVGAPLTNYPVVLPPIVKLGAYGIGDPGDNTVENAICAVRNYDGSNPGNPVAGGIIDATWTTFRNNIRHLSIYNCGANATYGIPTDINGTNYNSAALIQHCDFINTATFAPPVTPVDMVYLNNSNNITLWSCRLHNYNVSNTPNITGVNAVNATFLFQAYPMNPTWRRSAVIGFKTGIAGMSSLQTNNADIIANVDFDSCTYAINLSGCFKPFIINNNIHMLQHSAVTQGGIYMDNCTGYRVEANNINAVGIKNIFGILPRNSGTASNEVYRNAVVNCEVGVEAMGINRSANGTTGLKILCNNLSSVYRSGIYVVPTSLTIPPPSFGIASQQQTIVSTPFLSIFASAANTFSNGSPLTRDFEVFPTSNPITPYSEIYYRYSPSIAGQKPINTSLLAANIIATSTNSTCPVQTTGAKPTPFPFSIFIQNNTAIEKEIREVKTTDIASTDPAEILAYLYTRQAKLIDSIIDYYQYMSYSDTMKDTYTDSIARVYEQVSTNYEYQVYQASAYRDLGRYEDAIALLGSLAERYQLGEQESQQVAHIADMYATQQWLQQNDGDWNDLPAKMKDQVYSYEQEDVMFAGAIARSLLAQYEARSYDPIYMAPEDIVTPMSYKVKLDNANNIYPNPATNSLNVCYTGDNAVLVITDIVGREVLRQSLNSDRTIINISKLTAGIYSAAIWSGTNIQYQQKVVKN